MALHHNYLGSFLTPGVINPLHTTRSTADEEQGLPEVLTAPSFLRQKESSVLHFSCNHGPNVECAFMFKCVMMILDYVFVGHNCISSDGPCGMYGPVLKVLRL